MATNVFFDQAVKTEQNLVEDLVVESLRMYGHNVFYLPRNIVSEDQLLGEAPVSSFEDAYEVEMYLEGVEGFEGRCRSERPSDFCFITKKLGKIRIT